MAPAEGRIRTPGPPIVPPPTKEEEEALILKWQRMKNAEGITSIRDVNIYDRDDNPFFAFHWYVTRATPDGKVHGADQKISREDALKLNTINGAYLTFEENVKGSIEPGKLADFVILNQALMTVPDDQILATHALATYLGGKEVFSRKDSGF